MGRIRAIKPEARTSKEICSWPFEVRLFWWYLAGYLDDDGRGEDDARLIIADTFPRDREVTEELVAEWLDLIATTTARNTGEPMLCRYEVDGTEYLHSPSWYEDQKPSHPTRSRIPVCPTHEHLRRPTDDRPGKRSGSSPEKLPQGSGSRSSEARGDVPEPLSPRAPGSRDLGIKGSRDLGIEGSAAAAADARPLELLPPPLPGPVEILRTKLTSQGMVVRWDQLTADQLAQVVALVDVHGDGPLIKSARNAWRPDCPASFAQAWLGIWASLPEPGTRLRVLPAKCPEHSLDMPCTGCAGDRKAGQTQHSKEI